MLANLRWIAVDAREFTTLQFPLSPQASTVAGERHAKGGDGAPGRDWLWTMIK
jgi:hypothetical protein